MIFKVLNMLLFTQRSVLLSLGLGLMVFELLMHWFLASSALGQFSLQMLQLLPPQVRSFLGDEGGGFLSQMTVISIAYTHPFIFVLFTFFPANLFSKEISSAREHGILELTLSRPISRSSYLSALAIFFFLGCFLLCLCLTVGVAFSLSIFDFEQGLRVFLPVIGNLFCLFLMFGSLFLLINTAAGNHHKAVGWMVGFILGFYLLEYIGRSIKFIGQFSVINPFHYYRPQSILSGGEIPWGNMAVLTAAGVILFLAGLVVFRRRDV